MRGVLLPLAPRGSSFEDTVERLLQLVTLGRVGIGERLPPERELAAEWGVSRSTVREAIASLRDAGYVTTRRGQSGGTFVVRRPGPGAPAVATATELEDLLAHRLVLERGVAELAAERGLDIESLAVLRRLAADCRAAAPEDYRAADSRLHLAVAEASGSPSLVAAVAAVRLRVNELLDAIPLLRRNLGRSDDQHAALVDALVARDPAAARAVVEEHLAATAALLRGFLTT